MKLIILEHTLQLKCKSQEEFLKLLEEGYVVKEVKNIKYLAKNKIL